MKYLTFILFLLFSLQIVYTQEGPPAPSIELNVQTEGGSNTWDFVEFKLIPQGIQFCKEDECDVEVYSPMTAYSFELMGDEICLASGFGWRECDELNNIHTYDCGNFITEYAPLRLSFYQVEVYINSSLDYYFYYDNRDYSFVSLTCGNNSCTGNDITVRYNFAREKLEFYENSTISTSLPPTRDLSNGDIITWADWKCSGRDFSSFWNNGLVLVPNFNNNPLLIWGPNAELENILGYKIYRAVHWEPNPDPDYSLIATVNDETFDYTDTQLLLSGNYDYVYYYVIAYNSQTQSSRSNVINTRAGFYKKNNFDKLSSTSFGLNQNYPNPFNPSTDISFSIKETEYVTLIVYDVLGKEVARLVDGIKAAGIYKVGFDAAQLPSGIYFYELKAGTFRETKKMILTK